ncbi:hypothetical protein HOK51_08870 [Candidatus Woesearchaeota archaeon]|jgi:nucleoside 2-deoxyribosyltransferase|nr:hypothetical protein [Candidatus Woesearchaeota archaeon]MBT6519940.1 hypothetical protein [Candidatus Woesearchaeota archaeon]MBT7367859.1 hypothetical protein [Candidatus Woesearchaeota archaeon]
MKPKIVIGSSMKNRSLIKETLSDLEALGFESLFPNIDASMENKDVAENLEQKAGFARDHYKAIDEADAVYFILPKGYMGSSCKIELGYSIALKKPIYFSELTGEFDLDCYPKKIISLDELDLFNEEF